VEAQQASGLEVLADGLRERLVAEARGEAVGDDVEGRIRLLVDREAALLAQEDREALVRLVAERSFGLGPLEPLLSDPAVDEIMVKGPGTVWVERAGRVEATEVRFEDAAELRLQQRHVVRLEARPANVEGRGEVTIRRLVRNALRMRPDRIVVGEVRGAEALDMLAAMSSGHDGGLSTVHAGSPEEALRRLETLALMADVALPLSAVREQVAGAIDLVIHQRREREGERRVVAVGEVVRVAGGVGVREIYTQRDGRARWRAALGDELAERLAAA